MRFLKIPYKFVFQSLLVATFLPTSLINRLVKRKNYRQTQLKINKLYAGLSLRLWGINIEVLNKPKQTPKGWLMVSNHLGFIDAFSMIAHFPVNFVTSKEMKQTPLIGQITDMGCCFYVERRDRSSIHNEKAELVNALRQGYNIMLYPEGTSSDGSAVLPFKRTLMMAAAEAKVPLQLICIKFKTINNEPFSPKWRDHVCWHGDLSFLKHILLLFSLRSAELEIKFIDQLYINQNECKDAVSKRAHSIVSSHYLS
ncbi:MAG: 1-acyl-sn-glycerol-3-phosphate acyltransferase [Oligoflexia bacterium]|nr:1-acyl-sn-glycerol-3-phosphate acyltransferase [Oligoflexia bacterium]